MSTNYCLNFGNVWQNLRHQRSKSQWTTRSILSKAACLFCFCYCRSILLLINTNDSWTWRCTGFVVAGGWLRSVEKYRCFWESLSVSLVVWPSYCAHSFASGTCWIAHLANTINTHPVFSCLSKGGISKMRISQNSSLRWSLKSFWHCPLVNDVRTYPHAGSYIGTQVETTHLALNSLFLRWRPAFGSSAKWTSLCWQNALLADWNQYRNKSLSDSFYLTFSFVSFLPNLVCHVWGKTRNKFLFQPKCKRYQESSLSCDKIKGLWNDPLSLSGAGFSLKAGCTKNICSGRACWKLLPFSWSHASGLQ